MNKIIIRDREILQDIFSKFLDLSPKARRYVATEFWTREKILDRHEDDDYNEIIEKYGDL